MKAGLAILLLILAGGILVLGSAAYIVPEGRQAILTQFGRPVGDAVTAAGLHFKTPFIQEVREIDSRILSWDGDPNQIPTRDKKYIEVDTTARWRITDPLQFIRTVQNERGAQSKLDAVLESATRDVVSGHNLVEAVRNTNDIFGVIETRRLEVEAAEADVEEEVTGEIERVEVGRERLSELIAERAQPELEEFGITLVDVQLRRISYEGSVERKVFERMISERERIAEKIRSVGKGEQAKIHGTLSRDKQTIESEAYRAVQTIEGEADAKAFRIYADALGQDPDFYDFVRTLEAYGEALGPATRFLLTTDSDFLRLFKAGVRAGE